MRPDPAALMAQVDGQYFATMASSVFETIDREAKEGAAAAKAAVEAWQKAHPDVTVTWRDVVGQLESVVAREGQLSDLIVIGRPLSSDAPLDELALESALFGSGRPVLLLPLEGALTQATSAVIAWNASLESTRALVAGLPFLKHASKTVVLTIAEDGPGQPTAEELGPYLTAHGVKVEARQIRQMSAPAGQMILQAAREANAGLIVMGAYTHSRVRELFLGGATREALRKAAIPVLMAH